MRHVLTTLSGLAAAAMTLIMIASVASAHPLAPPDGGVAEPATQVVHHAGPGGWQVALIVAAAVVVIGLTATLVARRVRAGSHRPAVS